MIQFNNEQAELHKKLETCTDQEEIKKIKKRLSEIWDEQRKDWPFV